MSSPDTILLEFLHSNSEPIRLIDLGTEFLDSMKVPPNRFNYPFQVRLDKKDSKAGNAYYEYQQNGVPLPDGLNCFLRVEGTVIPLGKARPSKSGYPTREGQAHVVISSIIYKITAYITEARNPFYVKVVAHKLPDNAVNLKKAQITPRGGKIVF